ncbi:DNA primase [Microbacterium proteolyticum]|nr:DNA primase [Microbacterium proteolyticum]
MGDDSSSGEVVFTFDPDAAGQKAALRAFADEKRFAAQTYVAVAPEGLDPCDLRLQRGDGAVRALMENKNPMFEFVIDQRLKDFDLGSVEGRAGALRAAAPIVADIRDPSLRPGYVRVLARRLGLDMPEVQAAVERAARGADRAEQRENARVAEPAPIAVSVTMASLPNTRDVALERGAMMAFLQYGHRIDPDVFLRALQLPFGHPALEAVRSSLASTDLSQPGWAVAAVEAVREPFRSLAAELLTAEFPARTEEDAVASANDLARGLLVRELQREKDELLRGIQRVPPDSEEGRRLRLRLRELDADRQRLIAS